MNVLTRWLERGALFRTELWLGWLLVAGTLASLSAAAQETEELKPVVRKRVAPQVLEVDLSRLAKEAAVARWQPGQAVRVMEDLKEQLGPTPPVQGPVVASVPATTSPAALGSAGISAVAAVPSAMPAPGVNFDGIPATGFLPPDTVGDAGPNHYIQMVNTAFRVYDKQGNPLLPAPVPINSLWSGFGGPCETQNNGDPIVRYDHLADRWLISQFALPGGPQGLHECIAISRTPDPVGGGWFLYDFPTVDTTTNNFIFPDYPKIGVWPDAYYMGTQRGFPNGGLDVWAFERDQMLIGAAAALVQFAIPRPSLFLMPSDLDGPPPPAGTPNFFLRHVDGDRFGGTDRLEIFAFSVNWSNPALSTFNQVASLATAPFDSVLCSATLIGQCIPQPGTPQTLETLTVWPMWRLQYRNFGAHEAMVTNHTVDENGQDHAGIRWYELRRDPAGAWSIFQQGTHAPDEVHRWMGSIAMDRDGNMALGYSVSSDTVFPGIRYAGRLASDPLGTLPQAEVTVVAGSGSQTHGSGRWGNYSSMDVDPKDECTFWYTNEYYQETSVAGWRTRINSFRNPSCGEKRIAYEYAAKLICGLQRMSKNMILARGFYATAINIHNPNSRVVEFRKKLALTFPPEGQKPGKVMPIARDKLGPDEALEIDCKDIQRKLFPNGFPRPYIKGFVVIQSTDSLDVTAVYSTAGLDKNGKPSNHSSIDVEQIRERKKGQQCPDLVVRNIDRPSVRCPGGPGTCVTKVSFTVANVGAADAGAFNIQAVLDPAQSVVVHQAVPSGLSAGAEQTITVTTPPGGNCFDPDCTVTVTVDNDDAVEECDEQNNELSETTVG